jgi:subtilase family serine protease
MRRGRVVVGLTVGASLAAAALALPGPAGAAPRSTTLVKLPQRMCSVAVSGTWSCDAIRVVTRRVSSAKAAQLEADGLAQPATLPDLAFGPAGGYTPAQLAKAYGLNAGAATSQTVAIVDAFDDPSVVGDLNAFDTQYGLPAETTTSLKVVNQTGGSDLSAINTDVGWAGEISLDVQAVRGLCHHCKILLVEAIDSHDANLAAAVNYAAAHAKIVSNSYGGPETDPENTAAVKADYNHPGVAILAASGDDGWYGWDHVNLGGTSDNVPSTPASYDTVVGVGGTTLNLNADGSRAAESVWNDNGPDDIVGNALAQTYGVTGGAAGSGCSTLYAPRLWQQKVAGYATLGCGSSERNGVDIAAEADYFTGYDIDETTTSWCTPGLHDGNGNACPNTDPGWFTIGGTSLASPLVAAMWALAGGPAGVMYPALTLYGRYRSDTTHPLYDVTVGGTGGCDNSAPQPCANFFGVANPNTLGDGLLDCLWGATGPTPLANHYQCGAKPGYDGVSGVGTPNNANVFKPMSPKAVIKSPGTVTHGVLHTFSASGSSSPFPGGAIIKYVWNWGDGHTTTTTSVTTSHKYATTGKRTITLTVTDNYTAQNNGRTGKRSITITVR